MNKTISGITEGGQAAVPNANTKAPLRVCLLLLVAWPVLAQNVYVANNADNTITVIDAATDKVTATIPAGLQPWGVAVSPDGGRLYVTNHRIIDLRTPVPSELSVIDTAKGELIGSVTFDNTPGEANGVAISPDGQTVYVAIGHRWEELGNAVMVLDANTLVLKEHLRIPPDARSMSNSYPYKFAFAPDGKYVYVTHRYGDSVSVIEQRGFRLVGTILLRSGNLASQGSTTIAISPDGKMLYVGGISGQAFATIETESGFVSFPKAMRGAFQIVALAATQDGRRIYIARADAAIAYAVDTTSFEALPSAGISPGGKTLFVGNSEEMAITPDGRKAYLTNPDGDNVFVIDIAKNAVIGKIPVGKFPMGIAIGKAPVK